jgi:transposase InsO family protein
MILVTDIIPWFGLLAFIQSGKWPEFVFSISQKLAQTLNIQWRFHIPYHPQSSGKVERANHILKNTLTKLSLELHLDCKALTISPSLPLGLPKKTTHAQPL